MPARGGSCASFLFAVVLGTATAGCGGQDVTQPSQLTETMATTAPTTRDPAPQSSTSKTASPSATGAPTATAVPDENQAAIEAYKHYYETIYSLGTPTAKQVQAAFAPYAEAHVVGNWVTVFAQFAANDQRPSGTVTFGAIQVAVIGSAATVYECRDGTSETMTKVSTGDVLSHGAPGMRIDSQLNLGTDGNWRVSSSDVQSGGC